MPKMDERIARQLQLLCSVKTYNELTKGDFNPWRASSQYWPNIPNYLVSRCPFCGLEYFAQYDTYSLAHTRSYTEFGRRIAAGDNYEHETKHCEHFVAYQPFNYLNEFDEVIERGKPYESDAPGVQPHLLPAEIESIAVIHALPVCRVEKNQFVPRFTKFLVVYFSPDRRAIKLRWQNEGEPRDPDSDYEDVLIGNNKVDTNFAYWLKRGKLKWLDLDKPDLPLRGEPVEAFPYYNLVGKKVTTYNTVGELLESREKPKGIFTRLFGIGRQKRRHT
jgi:hypothetical protein